MFHQRASRNRMVAIIVLGENIEQMLEGAEPIVPPSEKLLELQADGDASRRDELSHVTFFDILEDANGQEPRSATFLIGRMFRIERGTEEFGVLLAPAVIGEVFTASVFFLDAHLRKKSLGIVDFQPERVQSGVEAVFEVDIVVLLQSVRDDEGNELDGSGSVGGGHSEPSFLSRLRRLS